MKVLIIIPAYNEGENLTRLISDIKLKCPLYDFIIVNDCSKDNTLKICRQNNADVLNLPVNLGIGGAVQAGYKYAFYKGYDVAVQLDGDGQHNPEYVHKLVSEVEAGADLCIGSRFIKKEGFQSTLTRRIGIIYLSKLIRFVNKQKVTDPTSGFRACNRKVMEYFSIQYPRDYPEPETIVAVGRKGFKVSEIPVIMNEREEGKSSITSIRSIYYMIKVSLAIVIASISKE